LKDANRSKKVVVIAALAVCALLSVQEAQAGLFGAVIGDAIAHHEAEKAQRDGQSPAGSNNNVLTNHPVVSAMAGTVAGAAVEGGIAHNFAEHPVRDSVIGVGGAVMGAGYLMEKYHCHEAETYDGVHQWTCNGVEGSHPWKQEAMDLVTLNATNARKLARNLAKAGEPRPGKGCAAHHIVSSDEKRDYAIDNIAVAKSYLRRCFININSSKNGVWLPQVKGRSACHGVYHRSMHSAAYYEALARRLKSAYKKGSGKTSACRNVRNTLEKIKIDLQDGVMP
jgi:hypothetical protein